VSSRADVIRIARSYLGPQNPDLFWTKVQPKLVGAGKSWCGGFALAVLHEAGLCDWPWVIWKGGNSPSGFLYRLPITIEPKPGDIAYFHAYQHHAIVEKLRGGMLHSIDGNQRPGQQVLPREKLLSTVAAFYSIGDLIPLDKRETDPAPPMPELDPNELPVLRVGHQDTEAVRLMQERLRAHGWLIMPDGRFGMLTSRAVHDFQLSRGLGSDGICGPKTWTLLLRDL
jgi:peptidoglycan hydrolase-like protein with peptidoglycan-binding domain